MKCAHCSRPIREAYYEQAGRTYGPTCGQRLGFASFNPKLWNSPITKHKASRKSAVVQDGQESLFLEAA